MNGENMTEVVAGAPPLGNIRTAVFDLDGVVYIEGHGIDGAGDALQRIDDAGITVLFASNNSTKTPLTAATHIAAATGYRCRAEQVVTSSLVTSRTIAGSYRRAYVVGETGLSETLESEGLDVVKDWRDADVVVVGLDRNVTFDRLAGATLAIATGGAAFVATNTDASFPTQEGPVPGGGALVGAIAIATGVEPQVFGKPNEVFRAFIKDMAHGDVVMVGDRPETDLAMGKAEGWVTVLVMSGVTTDASSVDPAYLPDHVVDSIAAVPGLMGL